MGGGTDCQQGTIHGYKPAGTAGVSSKVYQIFRGPRSDNRRNQLRMALCHWSARQGRRQLHENAEPRQHQQHHPQETRHRQARDQHRHLRTPPPLQPLIPTKHYVCLSIT